MKFTQSVPFMDGKYLIDYTDSLNGSKRVARFEDMEEAKRFVREALSHYVECRFPDGSIETGTLTGRRRW